MARPRHISDAELLDIARDVFAAEGPSATTATIAERAGISQAALFKRFGTKGHMLHCAFRIPEPCWIGRLTAGPDDRPMQEQLLDIGADVFAFFRQVVPRLAVLRGAGLTVKEIFRDEAVPPPVRAQRALSDWFRKAMELGLIRPTAPDVLAFAFLGPFQSRAFWQHIAGPTTVPIDDDTYVRSVLDVFWRGIAPEAPRGC